MRIFSCSRFFLSLVIFLTALSACPEEVKFEKREIAIESRGQRINLIAEIASTGAQREQGYMFRKEVKDGEGMLFIFQSDEILSFWMKNTLVPLSIAYIAHNGTILEIYDMEPGDLNPVRSSRSARFALEVPQNWFSRAGIQPGDRLDIDGL